MLRFSGRQSDLGPSAKEGIAVQLRYRVDEMPTAPVHVGLRCMAPYAVHGTGLPIADGEHATDAALCGTTSGAMLDLTSRFKDSGIGRWNTLSFSLSCLTSQGANLSDVESPLAIETAGRFAVTIGEARLVPGKGLERCGG